MLNGLERSPPIDRYRFLSRSSLDVVLRAFIGRLEQWESSATHRTRKRRPEDEEALTWSASVLLANLYAAARDMATHDLFIAISFGNGEYVQRDRYKRSLVSLSAMKALRDFLVAHLWVDFHPGFHEHEDDPAAPPSVAWDGYHECGRVPSLFIGLKSGELRLRRSARQVSGNLSTCVARQLIGAGANCYLPMRTPPETNAWRAALKDINEVLFRTEIGLHGGPGGADGWCGDDEACLHWKLSQTPWHASGLQRPITSRPRALGPPRRFTAW